jgi:carbamoyl-phosphate synthase small subunit
MSVRLPRFPRPVSTLKESSVPQRLPAVLVLADGTILRGISIGAEGISTGEVVFNTAMTGYQEILTDPSYCKQIVTLTYPHIGNTGVNVDDVESGKINKIHAAGLVIRDLPLVASNWRKTQTLPEYLKEHGVVAIAEIDTRKLTRILREKGAQSGCIMAGNIDDSEALEQANKFPGLAGMDLAKVVSCSRPYEWIEGEIELGQNCQAKKDSHFHIVALDFGIKQSILRKLAQRDCKITVVPAQTSVDEIFALQPDGVFLSNGPGDPEPCDYAIETIKKLLEKEMPIFGICLGHQLLGLATGAKTIKMKFGHHGANHPVQNLDTKRVMISSQNHGFAIDAKTLPQNIKITHLSLFDGSLQGIELTDRLAFSFQGHPEASPGPHDVDHLFDCFVRMIENKKNQIKQ